MCWLQIWKVILLLLQACQLASAMFHKKTNLDDEHPSKRLRTQITELFAGGSLSANETKELADNIEAAGASSTALLRMAGLKKIKKYWRKFRQEIMEELQVASFVLGKHSHVGSSWTPPAYGQAASASPSRNCARFAFLQ